LSANQRAYSIPEIKLIIKAKKANNAWPCGPCVRKLFRNGFTDAAGGWVNGDKDIHGQKNPHECGGTRPACSICIEVLVFKGVCYSVAWLGEKESNDLSLRELRMAINFLSDNNRKEW